MDRSVPLIRCYQYSSSTWVYTCGGKQIGWYMKWGLGSCFNEDNEEFRWRSEFEAHLLERLKAHMAPALSVIIDV